MTRRFMHACWISACIVLVAGCAASNSPKPTEQPQATVSRKDTISPISNTDPCATQMHELCGALLLYYNLNRQLPPTLEGLRRLPGFESINTFNCPVSGERYTYKPEGIQFPERHSAIVVFDATPAHAGLRWAIEIVEPTDDKPPYANVVPVIQDQFGLLKFP